MSSNRLLIFHAIRRAALLAAVLPIVSCDSLFGYDPDEVKTVTGALTTAS